MIEVAELKRGEEEAWDSFLLGSEGGLIFHSIRYRNLLVEHLGCESEYLVARESGEIRGVLPIMWSEDPDGRVCNSLPFFGSHGGPIAAEPGIERALIDAWNDRATDDRTLAGTMVANPFLDHEAPLPVHGLTDERISQVTVLPKAADPDSLLAVVESSARRNVRKAERLGFEVQCDHGALADLGRIHQENLRTIGGIAKSQDFFEAIPRHMRPGADFDVWVARRDGVVVAGLLVFYFNQVAEYFTPAVLHDHRGDQPLAQILVRAMVDAAQRGCRLWNWGGTGTGQEGVFRFKRKWGARDVRYRYFVQVNDEQLLGAEPENVRARFRHFYVVPFSAPAPSQGTPTGGRR